ncbi:hypothetical protein STENM223S_01501 [Streptomyces tendae]
MILLLLSVVLLLAVGGCACVVWGGPRRPVLDPHGDEDDPGGGRAGALFRPLGPLERPSRRGRRPGRLVGRLNDDGPGGRADGHAADLITT